MHLTKEKIPFKKYKKLITQFSLNDTEIIMGGDFNFTENPKLDRYKRNRERQTDTSSHSFNDLKQNLVLLMFGDICIQQKKQKKTINI